MTKKFLCLIFLLTALFYCKAQMPSVEWSKCLGGTQSDQGYALKETTDGGYLIGATVSSNDNDVSGNHGGTDYWIVKLDTSGAIQWQKCYGGSGIDNLRSLEITHDGGFIMAGSSSSIDGDVTGNHGPFGNFNYWIVKCDVNGLIEWQKCFGGSDDERAERIINCYDGGYAVIGISFSHDSLVTGSHWSSSCPWCGDAWMVKLDSSGNKQWDRCFGGTYEEDGYSLIQTNDSGFVLALNTGSDDGDVSGLYGIPGTVAANDYWIVKIDMYGNVQLQKCIGGNGFDRAYDIIPGLDGGYKVIGGSYSNDGDVSGNHGITDAWLVHLDSLLIPFSQRAMGGSVNDYGKTLIQLMDSSLITLGSVSSSDGDVSANHGLDDLWLNQISTGGNLQWEFCMGGSGPEIAADMVQTSDGKYVILCSSNSSDGDVISNHGGYDAWLIKLSSSPSQTSFLSFSLTDFAANFIDMNSSLNVTFYSGENQNLLCEVIDITGRVLMQRPFTSTQGLNSHEFKTGGIFTGIYLVRLESANGCVAKKVPVHQ